MRNPRRASRLHIVKIDPPPEAGEAEAIRAALERIVDNEHRTRAASVWLRAARSQGRRLGMYDYRDRFSPEDAWRLSARFPVGGREYPGLIGRGDAR